MTTRADLNSLLRALRSPLVRERNRGATALAFVACAPDERETVVLALIEALGDRTASVRRAAASSLASHADARAVKPLIALLSDRSSDVVHYAAQTLGILGDRRALEPLRALAERVEPNPVIARAISLLAAKPA